jgi:hypothetical protein
MFGQNKYGDMKTKNLLLSVTALWSLFTAVNPLFAQGTAFTYQGQLQNNGNLVNGNYDLRLLVYNDSTAGSVIGGPATNTMVAVSNGLFTTIIDFGAGVFTGSSNWLHIGVRTNGSGAFTGLLPRQQLTPTPYAIFAESANAAGLTGPIPAGDLSGVSGIGLTGVALLAGGNNFTGNQTVNGTVQVNGSEQITGASGAGFHVDENIGPNSYFSGEEHGINFNYGAGAAQNIGSLIMGWNGQGYFTVGNLYTSIGQSGTKAFTVFGDGNVNIDPTGMNSGFINNGNTNSSGLTFGVGSGEGIASKRTAGGNQFGLDFYTSFANRLSINNAGDLLIQDPSQTIVFPATSGANSPMIEMFASGTGNADRMVIAHSPNFPTWGLQYQDSTDRFNFLEGGTTVMTVNLSQSTPLVVNGNFAVVNGYGNEQAYMGGDGSGGDVQFGSLNSAIDNVAFYNATKGTYMHIYCSSITIEGGADLAEPFKITSGNIEVPQGAVVVIDELNPGHLKLSDKPYDTRVAGVVSGANGINPGIQMQQQGILEGGKNVALTGRVYVQADVSNGTIKPGDLLTTSRTPGYAMKVTDHARAQGAILGKAMTGLSERKGMVLVLVTLQ